MMNLWKLNIDSETTGCMQHHASGGPLPLIFTYRWAHDLFIMGLFTLQKYYKVWYFQNKGKFLYYKTPYHNYNSFGNHL
jgi:hypothetical protein